MDHNTAGDHRADGVERVLERRGDTEITAAAANGPEEIRVLVGAGAYHTAVGHHHVGGPQVVECEAVLRHQPANSAAQRQARDPRAADDAAGRGQSVQLCLAVELFPQHAALRAYRAYTRVHVNAFHRRQIDHHTLVYRRPAPDIVTSASYRHVEAVRAGQSHRIDDVGDAVTAGNERRMLVDQSVMDSTDRVIVRGRPAAAVDR